MLFGLVLVAIAVPGALTLFPEAQGLVSMGLINTRLGVMLIYISLDLPLAIFFLRAAFLAVPKQLVEAMRVDGASRARIATRLFLPMSASTLVVVVVLTVLQVWNESLILIVMTNSAVPLHPASPRRQRAGRDGCTRCELAVDRSAAARVPRLAAPLPPRHSAWSAPLGSA